MKPTHNDLCAAIVILGGERIAYNEVRPEEAEHLANRGLACFEDGKWWLTPAGEALLPDLLDGNEIPSLI